MTLLGQIQQSYKQTTSKELKILDFYLCFTLFQGLALFVYFLLSGAKLCNNFIGAFVATVGCFVLTGFIL